MSCVTLQRIVKARTVHGVYGAGAAQADAGAERGRRRVLELVK
jgi:hypothetical protein